MTPTSLIILYAGLGLAMTLLRLRQGVNPAAALLVSAAGEGQPRVAFSLTCARQSALTWRRKSSTHPSRGRVGRTARAWRVTANLEEAEGKALA